jgi:hypothetical protein
VGLKLLQHELLHVVEPGATGEVRVFAYPKDSKVHDDTLVLTTLGNPEAVALALRCEGVVPALEIESRSIQFERTLLRRTDTKMLVLRNPCKLPVAWQLVGLELAGPELAAQTEQGVIDPLAEQRVPLHFKSLRPMQLKKVGSRRCPLPLFSFHTSPRLRFSL